MQNKAHMQKYQAQIFKELVLSLGFIYTTILINGRGGGVSENVALKRGGLASGVPL